MGVEFLEEVFNLWYSNHVLCIVQLESGDQDLDADLWEARTDGLHYDEVCVAFYYEGNAVDCRVACKVVRGVRNQVYCQFDAGNWLECDEDLREEVAEGVETVRPD